MLIVKHVILGRCTNMSFLSMLIENREIYQSQSTLIYVGQCSQDHWEVDIISYCLFMNVLDSRGYIYISKKSHTFEYFKHFRSMIEKQTCKFIKILHSNQVGKYKKVDFNKCWKDHGIFHLFTIPHTPKKNRVAERIKKPLWIFIEVC